MIKSSSKGYAGIDCFRMIAAFMVIAIHTSPFLSWNETLDFLITFVICRLAVPFFLTCTGFFVLGSFCETGKSHISFAISSQTSDSVWRIHDSVLARQSVCRKSSHKSGRTSSHALF